MKTLPPKVSKTKTASIIDFTDEVGSLPEDAKAELLTKIGDLLVEEILSSCADSKSPVDGSNFEKLSKRYGDIKLEEIGTKAPNLDFTGDMLSALDFNVKGNKIELGVFGSEAPKADGHNNLSGDSKLPTRRFLPDEGEGFSDEIKTLLKETIAAFTADNTSLDPNKLKEIGNKAELYEYLREEIGDYSRAELKRLVLQSERAVELDQADLLRYL